MLKSAIDPVRIAGAEFAYPATNAVEFAKYALPVCQLGRPLMDHPPMTSLSQKGASAASPLPRPKGNSQSNWPLISLDTSKSELPRQLRGRSTSQIKPYPPMAGAFATTDRKSTRLNSSH